ncbi:hypothetical protein ASG01_05575 [Chryseobacterium sp. Leaf180]|uniref:hypothetical protein n=1 Tax=Chryseobacterium sp. Leaf180 TaxID=1736289 RepID=UPI000701ECD1|nr:hypothetical protein [Chryseobacterium sp. Leaf180]KQR95315.1 hypothetical protein ASG01_05575 [Chryseobacterium sp. Leaf180]
MKKAIIIFLIANILNAQEKYPGYIQERNSADISKIDKLVDNQYVEVVINGDKQKFLFDTGAYFSSIFQSDNNHGLELMGKMKIGSAFNESLVIDRLRAKTFNTSITKTEYRVLNSAPSINELNKCEVSALKGVLGLETYFDTKLPFLLDYKNQNIKLIENFDRKNFPEYSEVTSSYKGLIAKLIFVDLLVNGKKERFLFDSGADVSIMMKDIKEEKYDSMIEFTYFTSTGLQKAKQLIKNKNTIQLNKNITVSSDIMYYENTHSNILGIQFIKNFNWIIDKKNRKVYVKQNTKENISNSARFKNINYLAVNQGGKLIVNLSTFKDNKNAFKVGDEILKVNNQSITPQNICEMQSLLNSTKDWSNLKIETNINNLKPTLRTDKITVSVMEDGHLIE